MKNSLLYSFFFLGLACTSMSAMAPQGVGNSLVEEYKTIRNQFITKKDFTAKDGAVFLDKLTKLSNRIERLRSKYPLHQTMIDLTKSVGCALEFVEARGSYFTLLQELGMRATMNNEQQIHDLKTVLQKLQESHRVINSANISRPLPPLTAEKNTLASLITIMQQKEKCIRKLAEKEQAGMPHECNLLQINPSGQNILHEAVRKQDVQEVAAILGEVVESLDDIFETLLAAYTMPNFAPLLEQSLVPAPHEIVNQADEQGNTPLHLACERNSREIVQALVRAGADTQAVNSEGFIPFHIALKAHSDEIVEYFLELKNFDVTVLTKRGENALHLATQYGDAVTLRKLLDTALFDCSAKNGKGETILHLAAVRGDAEIFTIIIPCIADINEKDKRGNTPLDLAAQKPQQHKTLMLKLIGQGARLNIKKKVKKVYDCLQEWLDEVKKQTSEFITLKKNGQVIDEQLLRDNLALQKELQAVCNECEIKEKSAPKIVRPAPVAKARPKASGQTNKKPDVEKFCELLVQGNNKSAIALLKKTRDKKTGKVPWINDVQRFPLDLAIASDDEALVGAVVAAGANVNGELLTGKLKGWPFFFFAFARPKILPILLAAPDARPNEVLDPTGNNLLHIACNGDYSINIVRALLEGSVDPNKLNDEGKRAIELCKAYDKRKLIFEYMDKKLLSVRDIFFYFCEFGYASEVNEFLNISPYAINWCDENGQTPLHIAADNGHVAVIKALFEHGADPRIKIFDDEDKMRPFDVALKALHEIVPTSEDEPIIEDFLCSLDLLAQDDVDQDECEMAWDEYLLYKAIIADDFDVAFMLIKENEKILEKKSLKNRPESPFHIAALHGSKMCATLLVHVGADINTVNAQGKTALSYIGNNFEMGYLLVKSGIDVTHVDNSGRSVLFDIIDDANGESKELVAFVAFLIKNGASLGQQEKSTGNTIFHHVLAEGLDYPNVMTVLIAQSFQVPEQQGVVHPIEIKNNDGLLMHNLLDAVRTKVPQIFAIILELTLEILTHSHNENEEDKQ